MHIIILKCSIESADRELRIIYSIRTIKSVLICLDIFSSIKSSELLADKLFSILNRDISVEIELLDIIFLVIHHHTD